MNKSTCRIISLIFSFLPLALSAQSVADPRLLINFNEGWKFQCSDNASAWQNGFDDSQWRLLNLPHDWSIEGSFNEQNPSTPSGGSLPGGIGWYRKTFSLPASYAGKMVYVDFDGVYRLSEVWINGHYLGKRPYGYSSFRYDISEYIHTGNKSNLLAVRVDNSLQQNSRWYSGSGIYRNVWLEVTGTIAVDHWGTYITTPEVNQSSARVVIRSVIRKSSDNRAKVVLQNKIMDENNKKIANGEPIIVSLNDSISEVSQEIKIENPHLWSDRTPYLYTVVTEVLTGGKVADRYVSRIGIRSFEFDVSRGFILNGQPVKIRGVCNHHDLGCLGSAINTRALERQLELLKAMGCNGIRTSHNPPAPELLNLCDRMGFIVMDEAFDMWKKKKTDFDYGLDFDAWHQRDLEDMILRDRNHPSVFIWSIGNEILEQWDSTGIPIARELASIVHKLDPTRPITSACNDPVPWNNIIKSGALDLIGYNYHEKTFADFPSTFPGQKFIATETTSALASRGSYDLPADSVRRWPVQWDKPFNEGNADLSCSSYDNCSTPWGTTHEETWKLIKKYDFLSGFYIWTGFDYLGEPTPYWWPAHSSYFGILDLCGFPKDVYYMYQSEWTETPMLHIFPHWNWKPGTNVDVWAYSNCEEVELFLNGKSLGAKHKLQDELHFSWKVPFEPGTLTGVARTQGKEILRQEIRTAGSPARIVLSSDRTLLNSTGNDLAFCIVRVLDENNNLVPYAENLIQFKVEGEGVIEGVDNGNQVSLEPFKDDKREAFHGMCLLVVRSTRNAGTIRITADSKGLETSIITLINK